VDVYGELSGFSVSWSADSRWITYAGDKENRNSAIVLYDCKEGKRHEVTSGFYNDELPVFDPDGKYLFFRTGRTFDPTYGDLDGTWIYANSGNLAAVPLRKDVASPLAPRNDEETDKDKDKKKDEEKKDDEKKSDRPTATRSQTTRKTTRRSPTIRTGRQETRGQEAG